MLTLDEFEKEFRKEVDYNRQCAFNDVYVEDWDKYPKLKAELDKLRKLKRKDQSAYERELKKYREKIVKVKNAFEKKKERDLELKQWRRKQKEYRDMMIEADAKRKYTPLSYSEKKQITQRFSEEERLIYTKLLEKRLSLLQEKEEILVDTLDDVYDYVSKINLVTILEIDIELGYNFRCIFYEGYKASINHQNGCYKYFTNTSDNNTRIVMGLIDIIEIFYDCNFAQATIKLCNMLNIKSDEVNWMIDQEEKYQSNLELIRESEFKLKVGYPILHKYIKKHLYLMDELNRIGQEHIMSLKESVGEDSIFFVSSRFLQKKLKEKGYSKKLGIIISTINMFCVLGLINKVRGELIPKHLRERAVEERIKTGKNFMVSFYVIPKITEEVLAVAEQKSKMLKKAKVPATLVRQDTVLKVFGDEEMKLIYANTYYWAEEIKMKKKEAKERKSQQVEEKDIITNNKSGVTDFSDIPTRL